MRSVLFVVIGLVLGLVFAPAISWASGDCAALFKLQQFTKAAQCFTTRARRLPSPPRTPQQRTSKGRLLRNAALSYSRAADASSHISHAMYYRELALHMLKRYTSEKLYETEYRKKSAMVRMYTLRSKLRYASLTVVTGRPKTSIQIEGFQLTKRGFGQLSTKLRPGRYKITVRYTATQVLTKRVTLQPDKGTIESFRPTPTNDRTSPVQKRAAIDKANPPKPIPGGHSARLPVALSLLITGGASALTGGVLFGIARAAEAQRQQAYAAAKENIAQQTPADTKALGILLSERQRTASTLQPWGVGLSIAGVALLAGGCLTWYLLRRTPQEQTPPTPKSQRRMGRWQ